MSPKNNEIWNRRSPHSSDKLLADPALLWEAACEYFRWCTDNPLTTTEVHGRDNELIEVPRLRPFTIEGLCLYLGCTEGALQQVKNHIGPASAAGDAFPAVIARIEKTIYAQQYEGAAAGLLNHNIVARRLGLAERSHTENLTVTAEAALTDADARDLQRRLIEKYT